MIEDAYGNYLIQNVLKLNCAVRNEMILSQIARKFIRLSQLKFSSNVIEKCLDAMICGPDRILCIEHIFRGTFKQDDVDMKNKQQKKSRVEFIVEQLIFN